MTKRPSITTATILSFLVPGAGLCYLGYWMAGFATLVVSTAVVLAAYWAAPNSGSDYLLYLALCLMAGAAGGTHAVARQAIADGAGRH